MTFIICALLHVALSVVVGDQLYEDCHNVKMLAGNNFSSTLINEDPFTVHVVEFYSSTCGHCVNFAPSWESLANSMSNWKPYVVIAAINCNNQENFDVCKNQQIIGYPTFMIYTDPTDPIKGIELLFNRMNLGEFKSLVMQRITVNHNKLDWYSILEYRPIDYVESQLAKYDAIIVIVETEDSFQGRVLIMDFLPIRNSVPVYRISPGSSSKFHLSLNENIAVYQYFNNTIDKIDKKLLVRSRPRMVTSSSGWNTAIENKLISIGINVDALYKNKEPDIKFTTTTESYQKTDFDKSKYKIYLADIEAGLSYMFQTEIASKSEILGTNLEFLKEWIELILKYIPVREHIQNSLHSILNLISTQNVINGIDIRNEALNSTPNKFMSEQYFHCKGSKPHFRGYPCSVWLLYHTLTVRYAELTSNKYPKYAEAEQAQRIFDLIRNYMEYFFTCRECAKHFLEHADDVKSQIHGADSFILVMWKFHNRANYFLQGTLTDDITMPKTQFPPAQLCDKCRLDNGIWNEEEVLKFLKTYYQPDPSVVHTFDGRSAMDVNNIVESPWLKMQQRQNELDQKASSSLQTKRTKMPIAIRAFIIVCSIISLMFILWIIYLKLRKHNHVQAQKIV